MHTKFLAAASAAAITVLAAAPAAAQSRYQPPSEPGGVFGAIAGAVLDALTPDEVRRLPLDRRQEWLDQRIDQGVRDGSLTRAEAGRLRSEFRDIARLEASYRTNGLSYAEQAELDRRFDLLSNRIYDQRSDAQARGWQPVDSRQAQLEERIDAGIRNGTLDRREAARLRDDYWDIARLEARYRTGGLSYAERADLDRRFDDLSARIRTERHDGQQRAWVAIDRRQAELDGRIDAGVRNGALNQREAARLRAEYQGIARLEARYRQDGLAASERADLDTRFDRLSARIAAERRDDDAWVGVNQRQAKLDDRIDAGVRNGALTRGEAKRLRADFRQIARLEAQYRGNGLLEWERADLDRRMDELSARIRDERRDRQARR